METNNWTVKMAMRKLALNNNKELANLAGCHPGTISLWTRNKKGKIPPKFHAKLNKAYNKIVESNDVRHREEIALNNVPTQVVTPNVTKNVNVFVINTNPRDIPMVVESLSK